MAPSRRHILQILAGGIAATGFANSLHATETSEKSGHHDHDMSGMPAHWHGNEVIAMLLYPGFTALDLVGPHYMLGNLMGAKVHLVAKEKGPVMSDMKLAIVADTSFEDCPKDLTIFFAPGGSTGVLNAIEDDDTLNFVQDRGSRAGYVTSVCTGSILLGHAGLLEGYKATSHWVVRDMLKLYGATPVNERFVIDRNRVTGAGVTAGIDFGLSLVEKHRDTAYAKGVQLLAEYDPTPPFNAGVPEKAGETTTALIGGMFDSYRARIKEISKNRLK